MNKTLKMVIGLILVALYAAGLIAMVAFSFNVGVTLWVVSTLGGIAFLYFVKEKKKKDEEDKPCE